LLVLALSIGLVCSGCRSGQEPAAPASAGLPSAVEFGLDLGAELESSEQLLADIKVKTARLRKLLAQEKGDWLQLASPSLVSWSLAGLWDPARDPLPGVYVLIGHSRSYVVAPTLFPQALAARLQQLRYKVELYDWRASPAQEDLAATIARLTGGQPLITDCPGEGRTVLAKKLATIRTELTELEVARYEWLGKACNWAVASAVRQYQPLNSASDLAGLVYARLSSLGVKSLQLNVLADQQVYEATAAPPAGPILEQARIELEAERWGLRLQLARALTVRPPQGDLVASYEGCGNLLASVSGAATAGSTLSALFEALSQEYEALGYQDALAFAPAGGLTGAGEAPLLELVAPENQYELVPPRALVLEAQLGGAGLRETFLLTEAGLTPITLAGGYWPTKLVSRSEVTLQVADLLQVGGNL